MTAGQSETINQALRDVRDRFLFDLDQRICDFEHLRTHILNGPNRAEAIRAVAMMAHKIRGVAPTLDLARLGDLAGSVEDLFARAPTYPSIADFWRRASPLFESMLDEMERVQPDYACIQD